MSKASKYINSKLKSSKDWHVYWVYQDPEFQKDTNNIKSAIKKRQITKKYAISDSDLNFYNIQKLLPGGAIRINNKSNLTYNAKKGLFSLEFEPSITKAEFLDNWKSFTSTWQLIYNTNNKTRRRAPENTQLIYSIFKARQKQNTFREIFTLYSTGKLECFDGPSSQFKDEESLERYYRKYSP